MKKEEFLAMSLLHRLKINVIYHNGSNDSKNTNLIAKDLDGECDYEVIPILRPLSELDQILLSEFEKYHKNIDCDNEIIELFCEEHINTSDLISEINIEFLPFDTVIWMIKNHFDIAGLIEKGEAIDVNTLPENPYK